MFEGYKSREKTLKTSILNFFRCLYFSAYVNVSREKAIKAYINVSVDANLECGNM